MYLNDCNCLFLSFYQEKSYILCGIEYQMRLLIMLHEVRFQETRSFVMWQFMFSQQMNRLVIPLQLSAIMKNTRESNIWFNKSAQQSQTIGENINVVC